MVKGYLYNHETGMYVGETDVDKAENVVIAGYRTDVVPTGTSCKFDQLKNMWTEVITTSGPTAEQQMINALGLQVASLQATVTKLTTTNGGAA